MPSTWIWCGEPITASSTASRVGMSAGRSESLKNGPRDVPPRMMTHGILVCMLDTPATVFRLYARVFSERVAAQATIDRQHRAGDIAGDRRGEEYREHGEILGLAVAPHRNFLGGLLRAEFGGVLAADLLAHDAPGRDAVDRDAVAADLARQSLGPGMDRGLGGMRGDHPLRLRFAADVDDAAPFALDHSGQRGVGELAQAREVERHRLLPSFLGRIDGQRRIAAAGRVDQDVDRAERAR